MLLIVAFRQTVPNLARSSMVLRIESWLELKPKPEEALSIGASQYLHSQIPEVRWTCQAPIRVLARYPEEISKPFHPIW